VVSNTTVQIFFEDLNSVVTTTVQIFLWKIRPLQAGGFATESWRFLRNSTWLNFIAP
jgi:hypothetical protein